MLLKSLRLRGFKSFAGTTDVELAPGICVIVGPNGSGKSNVVDSLTWVMGTQGARQLRGASMEDVIFSGTPGRAALGRAEVMLTIDNSSGAIPLDASEVSIGRLLFRSGESKYTINGEQCRLLDVVELLSDAGVGRTFHNIVGQGRIDAILSATPEERRVAIEEAAGVLKHRKRRERAVRRLDGVEADLVRLEDLERELSRRLRPLERQVKGASRHAVLTAELAALSLWRAGRTVEDRRARLSAATGRVEQVRSETASLRATLRLVEAEVAGLDATVRKATESVDAARSAKGRYDRLVARLHGLGQLVAERRRNVAERLGALERSAGPADSDFGIERAGVEDALAELALAADDLEEAARRHAAELMAHNSEVTDLEAAWRAAGLDGDDRRAALGAQLSAARAALARSTSDRERLLELQASATARLGELRAAVALARQELAGLDATLGPLRLRCDRLDGLRDLAAREVSAIEDCRRKWESEAAAAIARAESFEAAAADGAGAERAASELSDRFGALARVRDLVTVESGAELAVAAALGHLLNAVVLPDGIAEAAIAAVKDVDEGSLTLVADVPGGDVISTPRRRSEEIGALSLLEVVKVRGGTDANAAAVSDLLQRELASVFLCRSATQALVASEANPDEAFVTPEGDRFRGGLLSVRSARRREAVNPALAAVASRRAAENAHRRAAEVAGTLAVARAELDRLGRDEKSVASAAAEAGARHRATVDAVSRTERELAEVERDVAAIGGQIAPLTDVIAREEARCEELRRHLEAEAPNATEDERAELEARRCELESRGDRLQQRSIEIEGERARQSERTRSLQERLGDIDRRRVSEGERRRRDALAAGELRAETGRLAEIAGVVEAAQSEASRRQVHVGSVLDVLQSRRAESLDTLQVQRSRAGSLTAHLTDLAKGEHEADIAAAEARLRLEAAEDVVRRELETDVETALAATLPEGVDAAEAAGRIETVQKELRRIGPVNPLALQEYEELQQRSDTLERELADVRHAKREIVKVIRQVDDKVAEVLRDAYADVQRHFADLFALLFPGGDGRVVLTDPEDVLGTGVEIEACPSGKSAKRLSLLSGGERSLAALAYLFAIFRARPSPFYVLDEVEAALDDINLHRFCNLVREFRKDGQIIVVTHQKRTMEIADVLYGVSLGEDGTSRVLSQRIVDLDLTAEEAAGV